MINNKLGNILEQQVKEQIDRDRNFSSQEKTERYVMSHCSLEDKPKTRHERRFPSWEKENWD